MKSFVKNLMKELTTKQDKSLSTNPLQKWATKNRYSLVLRKCRSFNLNKETQELLKAWSYKEVTHPLIKSHENMDLEKVIKTDYFN